MTKFKHIEQLQKEGFIEEESLEGLKDVVDKFSLSITENVSKLIDKKDVDDPIAKQFIPNIQELNIQNEELADPIGDTSHSPIKGIIHRYPDRCLFMPISVCPVYCRFCFRREKVGSSGSGLNRKEFEDAYQYIESHKEIWEVILTGGDPLFMAPKLMQKIMARLSSIDHVEIVRIHTRVPVVDPSLVTSEMVQAIKKAKVSYVILHANHPKEFTKSAKEAIAQIVDSGIPMLSQSVLLKGINDNPKVLTQLFREFIRNRVKPYYLHHGDFAKGTSHFRTSIEEGQKIMKDLRGHISGLCLPTYMLDIPGGYGKVPITPTYLSKKENAAYTVKDYQERVHNYPPIQSGSEDSQSVLQGLNQAGN